MIICLHTIAAAARQAYTLCVVHPSVPTTLHYSLTREQRNHARAKLFAYCVMIVII